jgi:transcriptional regulator with XRE-family HTH domain
MEKSTHTKEYAALCSELRRARERAGLSQRELAAKLQVPHSWIAKVENGERRVDLIEFAWFITACGADPKIASIRLLERVHTARPRSGQRRSC